jgi:hypothetical protein
MVRATADDPDAGNALAEAYATLTPDERAKLLDAVCEDAADVPAIAIAALSAMLTVEPDVGLARQIAARLRRRCEVDDEGLREPPSDVLAALRKDGASGEAILALRASADRVDVLRVRWVDETSCDVVVSLGVDGEVACEGLPEMPVGRVVGEVAPSLLAHRRRGGGRPEEVARFAPLFDHG